MSTVALTGILDAVAKVQGGIRGVKRGWPRLPDAVGELPCFINEPAKGTLDWPPRPNLRHVQHDIRMVLLVSAGQDAPSASNQAWPFVNQTMDAFEASATLGALVAGCAVTGYETGRLTYAGTTYYAVTFTLRVATAEHVIRTP